MCASVFFAFYNGCKYIIAIFIQNMSHNSSETMAQNHFLKEASSILQQISRKIANNKISTDYDVIESTLWFAIGVEKLLKGIIYNINPMYIMEKPEFKYSALCHYAHIISNKDGLEDPKREVISLDASIMRASNFSQKVHEHKNTLMKLKNARDIIVHRCQNELNVNELKLLLMRDYYPMLKAIGDENKLGSDQFFFLNLNAKLAEIAIGFQTDIDKKIEIMIQGCLKKWNTLKRSPGQSEQKFKERALLLFNNYVYPCVCPCCGNYASVITQPIQEFNTIMNQNIIIGTDVIKLKCGYCELEINDYKMLDHLKITPDIEHKNEIILRLKSDEEFMQ